MRSTPLTWAGDNVEDKSRIVFLGNQYVNQDLILLVLEMGMCFYFILRVGLRSWVTNM